MQGDPTAGQLIDGRQLAGDQRWRGEARPLRDQHIEPVGEAQDMLADLQAVRRGGMKRQQRAVEPGAFMRLGDGFDVMTVQYGAIPHDGFR